MTNEAKEAIHALGAEAQANGKGLDSYKLDIALRCGFESWEVVPAKLRAEATRVFLAGKRQERVNGVR